MFSSRSAGRGRRRLGALAVVTVVAAAGLSAGAATASAVSSHPARSSSSYATQVVADGVRLRTGPGTGYGVEGLLYYGDSVAIAQCSGGWDRVYLTSDSAGGLGSGTGGWVSGSYLEPLAGSPTGGLPSGCE
ncbi:SH3 domain-containing protein [Streptomyces sp. NPDC020096]